MAVTLVWLPGYLAKVPKQVMSLATKFGGLLIATIGAQLALNGIKQFFAIGVK